MERETQFQALAIAVAKALRCYRGKRRVSVLIPLRSTSVLTKDWNMDFSMRKIIAEIIG